jgi:NTP pyrophosphatase (non-canonical NTP hydrolase)
MSDTIDMQQQEPRHFFGDLVAFGSHASASVAGLALQYACHSAAFKSGWWQGKNEQGPIDYVSAIRTRDRFGLALVAEKLCLIHSEISEAMEGHRKDLMDDKLPHRKMIEVELADAVIRIADLCGAMGLDLGSAISEKLEFNAQRPDHKPENREKDGGKKY